VDHGVRRRLRARAEKGDLKLVYSYLERELTSDKQFDAILLPLNHGWEQLSAASREALARRVRAGCGLVLIRRLRRTLALTPSDLKPENGELENRCAAERSPRRGAASSIIHHARDSDREFPIPRSSDFVYRAEPGASVLIQTDSGSPDPGRTAIRQRPRDCLRVPKSGPELGHADGRARAYSWIRIGSTFMHSCAGL